MIPQIAAPAKIILSTLAGPEQRLTDVIMFNSRNLGALIVAEEPHVKSWEDGQYNIQSMSIEETYGFGILQEGQAVAVAKNVKIRPNEFVMSASPVFDLGSATPTRMSTIPTPRSGTTPIRSILWPKPELQPGLALYPAPLPALHSTAG